MLSNLRKTGSDLFGKLGAPKAKQEAFQYLKNEIALPQPASIADGEGEGIVFVDGFFKGADVQKPILCLPLDGAVLSYGLFLQSRWAKWAKSEADPLAALNAMQYGEGAFLYLPPKCKAALHLSQIFVSKNLSSSRLHVYVGKGAELELVQESQGLGCANHFIDFALDEGARVKFTDFAKSDFQAVRASLKRDSYLKAVFLGSNVRTSVKVELSEENSEAELFGLARMDGEVESHVHAKIEHAAPHTRSRQHFKSVVKDRARFSFEGKIFVKPVAQKTQAYQLNNNLILSDEAAAFAKPNLEIFADDVKASHGATTGQLDEEILFYLRSRGLSLETAKEWLIEGFCKEILDHAR